MSLFEQMVHGRDVSEAWLKATDAVHMMKEHHGYHLVVAIDDPAKEDPRVHRLVDRLIQHAGLERSVDTVANTIFPVGLTQGSRDFVELSNRFLALYPSLRKFHGNSRGTYFGRMLAMPTIDGPVNQLGPIIDRLQKERKLKTPYLIDFIGQDVRIYDPAEDKKSEIGFPCLSFCAFQRDNNTLHLSAHYRNHHMVQRAYGNYLGLGRLQAYVAAQTGLKVGRLTVLSGHAEIETSASIVRSTLDAAIHPRSSRNT